MEFGVFLNGYIPGPGAHDTEIEHRQLLPRGLLRHLRRQAQLEVRLVRRAPHFGRVQPHVRPRGGHGLRGRQDRLHPPGHGHQQPLAAQGAPGPPGRAGRHAGPHHQPPLRVGHRARGGQPRDGRLQHPRHRVDQGRMGRGGPRDPADVGASSTTSTTASTSPCPRPTTSCPSPTAPGTRPIWVACGNPPTFAKAGALGIGAIAFNFEPIFNLRDRIAAYKEAVGRVQGAARPVPQRQRDDDQRRALLRGPRQGPQAGPRAGQRLPGDHGQPLPRHHAQVARRHHLARRSPPHEGPGRR